MSFHAVEVSFPLGYQPPHWRYKPSNFITHFTGHEGPGSLHSYLKNKGWITALSAGTQNLARGFAMYKLTIYLTSDGFRAFDFSYSLHFTGNADEYWQRTTVPLFWQYSNTFPFSVHRLFLHGTNVNWQRCPTCASVSRRSASLMIMLSG